MGKGEQLAVARGERPADLVLRNGQVVNVLTGEVEAESVAVHEGVIVGLGDYAGVQVIDLEGQFVLPGLMDGHVHLESSLLDVVEFARAVIPHGTTAVFVDPHELANVVGLDGVRYVLEASRGLPLDVFVLVPSCVPASPFDDPGGTMTAAEIEAALREERVLGLAEMMDFPGTIGGDPGVLERLALGAEVPIDGHAPFVRGRGLNAYLLAGPEADHETTQWEEAREKARRGMFVFIREGSASRNLADLLPAVTARNARRFGFASDDVNPVVLLSEGHVDRILRRAIGLGCDPVLAVQMATLNLAERFRLRRRGAIAPGYPADLVIVSEWAEMRVTRVYKRGELVAENGELRVPLPSVDNTRLRDTVHVRDLSLESFAWPAGPGQVRAMQVWPTQILTRALRVEPPVVGGQVVSDPARDLLKVVAIERHRATGKRGLGLVKGFGLQRGALASSVGHDSHNLTAVGVADEDLLTAVRGVAEMGGGMAVAEEGQVVERLPLPLAGLMSDQPVGTVAANLDRLHAAARALGCPLPDPFMTLSFVSLAVIPELRLTPRGWVDVTQLELVEE